MYIVNILNNTKLFSTHFQINLNQSHSKLYDYSGKYYVEKVEKVKTKANILNESIDVG